MADDDTLDTLVLFELPAAQTPSPQPPAPRSIDDDVRAVLDVLNARPDLAEDRRKVVTAILHEARNRDGHVDPNRVRTRLANTTTGKPDLTRPQVVGAIYAALRGAGVLEFTGYVESTDKASGNAGKHARAYRLIRIPDVRDAAA